MQWLVVLAVAIAAFGCGGSRAVERVQTDTVGDPSSRARTDRERFMDPALLVPGWPFDDGKSQYRLFWDGGESVLPLFAEPDPNSRLVGQVTYKNGEEIETTGDYLAVYKPAIFRTRKSLVIEGVVHGAGAASRGQRFSKQLRKGHAVAVYGFADPGRCYLGVGGRIIIGSCPTPVDYVGTFEGPSQAFQMQPLEKIWWVQITTPLGSGWIPLDDRVVADILPLSVQPESIPKQPSEPQRASDAEIAEASPDAAQPADVQAREDELFGGSEEPTEIAQTAASEPATEAGLGIPVLTDEDIEKRLEARDDLLAIGALAFLQLQYYALEEGDYEEFPVRAPNLLDVYLDARPNPRVRAYARGRLFADFTAPDDAVDELGDPIRRVSADLDQLWMNFDLARVAYATIGKQRIKWGTGRFWNPTDFLNDRRLDPLQVAVFDPRLGVNLVKLHFPIESLGWNFYTIAMLEGARTPDDVGGAARAEFLYDLTEFSLTAAARREEPYRFGADLSTGFWWFDFRLEAAVLYRDPRPFYRGELNLPSTLPEEYSREDELIPQVVGGFELQIPFRRGDLMVIGAEYFYNDAGYPGAELYPWLFANDTYIPFYAARQYAGAYTALLAPGSWDDTNFVVTTLGNLSDQSFVTRLDITQTALTHLRWNVFTAFHFGELGEFHYGLEIEPNVFVPEGISIVPPLFDVGLGLQLDL